MKEFMGLLGHKVRDRISGMEGIAESVAFDLYGCVQICVHQPGLDEKENTLKKSYWMDHSRLEVLSEEPVMENPFVKQIRKPGDENGPAMKPDR